MLEHGTMDRLHETHPGLAAGNPADGRFERMHPFEPDPYPLVQLRALDELRPAALGRDIVNTHAEVQLAASAKGNLRLDGYTLMIAQRWQARVGGKFGHQDRLLRHR